MFELYKRHIKKKLHPLNVGSFLLMEFQFRWVIKHVLYVKFNDILFDGKQFAQIYLYSCITAHEMIKLNRILNDVKSET